MTTKADEIWDILAELATKQTELVASQKETERRLQEKER
jgi:hypothetical protein